MTQQYGTLKVDFITFTSGTTGNETDVTLTVSGLSALSDSGMTITGDITARNVTATGTLSGATITGDILNATSITGVTGVFTTLLSGASITGELISGTSGIYTYLSGASITGNLILGTSGVFTNVTGTTINSVTGSFTTGTFSNLGITGTITGNTVDFGIGAFATSTSTTGYFPDTSGTSAVGSVAFPFASGVFTNLIVNDSLTATLTTGLFGSGTESAPSISFDDDRDTGFYNAAANEVRITTSGNDRLTVDSTGNVGIGITSPTARLHIANDQGGAIGRILIDANVTSGYDTRIDATDDGLEFSAQSNIRGILFNTGGTPTERLRIDSSGRLLVGTSSNVNDVFGASLLQVSSTEGNNISLGRYSNNSFGSVSYFRKSRGSLGSQGIVSSNDDLGISVFSGSDGSNFIQAATIKASVDGTPGTNDMPGRLVFSTSADGSSSPTERLRITSAGNVGIGITNPLSTLHVQQVNFGGTSSNEVARFISNTTGGLRGISIWAPGDTSGFGKIAMEGTSARLSFWTGTTSTEKMSILSNGNVGIGTAAPAEKLQVTGGILFATANRIYSGSSNRGNIQISSPNETTNRAVSYGNNYYVNTSGNWVQGTTDIGGSALELRANNGNYGEILFRQKQDPDSGGNERIPLVIDTSGRIGIGTTAPVSLLHLNTTGLEIRQTFQTSTGTVKIIANNDDFIFDADQHRFRNEAGSSEYMRIDANGNVGIGTSSPGALLEVRDTANSEIRISDTSGGYGNLVYNESGTVSAFDIAADPANTSVPATELRFSVDGSRVITCFNNGNVGIGTTNPSVRLEVSRLGSTWTGAAPVAGTALFVHNGNNGSTSSAFLGFGGGTSAQCGIQFGDASAANVGSIIYENADNSLRFDTSFNERMRIDSSGNVGIGTSSPGEKFQVTGKVYITDQLRVNKGSFTITGSRIETIVAASQVGLAVVGSNSTVKRVMLSFHNPDNTKVGQISIKDSITTYSTSSDYRLKENVVNLTGAIDRLKLIDVYRFNFIGHEPTVDGFIAHELQDVVPECVTGTKDEVDDEGNPVYQGIDQSKIVPLLTAALQEALAKIETLEQRLTDAGL